MDLQETISSVTDSEQRAFIKFGFLLNRSGPDIHRDLTTAIGRRAYPLRTVQRWLAGFRKGRNSTEEARGGPHHVASDHQERLSALEGLLEESRGWSVRELSLRLQLPSTSIYRMLTDDLKLTKRLGKWVPHELTEDQMECRSLASRHNLLLLNHHPYRLKQTLAIDETWVSLYTPPPRDKQKFWLRKGERAPEIPAQGMGERKRMLIMAMDFKGIAFWHLYEEGETVTSEAYRDLLSREIPKWLQGKNFRHPILLHNNARPHKARLIKDFLKSRQIEVWDHPPYSPDLNPCDFNCFGPLKRQIKRNRYADWNQLQQALEAAIRDGSERGLYKGVQMLPERWEKVVENEGAYL